MNEVARLKLPWTQRLLVWFFTGILGLLSFWLIGFVLGDVGAWPGPDFQALSREMIDPALQQERESLTRSRDDAARQIERDTKAQLVLRDSTDEAQRTMKQMLDFQRLGIEKGVNPTPEQQSALADSQRIFLENQERYQKLSQQIAETESRRLAFDDELRAIEERIHQAEAPVEEAYAQQFERYRWRVAAAKLTVMLPLIALAVLLFLRWRGRLYAPLAYALGMAVILRTALVMHEYFPARYFKYVLIGVSLLVVLRLLTHLLRAGAFPRRDAVARQNREAYERFLCPVCEYPIRRGPLAFSFWTRRTAKRLVATGTPDAAAARQPYTCPVCATRLYDECPQCHEQRATLLAACQHCGATHTPVEPAAQGTV